jgi:hypothetical protein
MRGTERARRRPLMRRKTFQGKLTAKTVSRHHDPQRPVRQKRLPHAGLNRRPLDCLVTVERSTN